MKISKQAIDFAETVRDLDCRHEALLAASRRVVSAFEAFGAMATNTGSWLLARQECESAMVALKEVTQ